MNWYTEPARRLADPDLILAQGHGARLVFDACGDVLEIALDGVGQSILAPRDVGVEVTERGRSPSWP